MAQLCENNPLIMDNVPKLKAGASLEELLPRLDSLVWRWYDGPPDRPSELV